MKKQFGFILLTLGVFIILFCSKIFQHGLFFDGLIYSSIAQNLTEGFGSFWFPHFSETIHPVFYEHPPLAHQMESVLMNLFDSAFYTEKIYSTLMACLTILFIVLIWRNITEGKPIQKLFWLPVLLWVLTPKNSWAFTNNILENTMGVFTISSIYVLLLSINSKSIQKRLGLIVLGGFLLLPAFLSKGFPGLFPLGFFVLYFLARYKEYSFIKMLRDSLMMLFSAGLCFFLLFYFNESALKAITNYIEQQVVTGITGQSRVNSRIVLMQNLFNELIPLLIIVVLIFGFYRRRMVELVKTNRSGLKNVLLFFLIGLSASVPLMVSPKFSSFYLICALPYFALVFALFLGDTVGELVEKLNRSKIGNGVLYGLGGVAISTGLFLTISNAGTVGRDYEILNDIDQMEAHLPEGEAVTIYTSLYNDWTTIAYLNRYLQVSCDKSGAMHEYYLVPHGSNLPEDYELIPLETQKFDLLRRID